MHTSAHARAHTHTELGRKNWARDTDLGISNITMKTEAMG